MNTAVLAAAPPLLLGVLLLVYVPQAAMLAWIDASAHRLPNRRVAVLTGTTLLAVLLCALVQPALLPSLRVALVLAAILGFSAILIALLAPALLGMGDAKTTPVVVLMACALGGEVFIAGALGAMVLAAVLGVVVLARTGRADVRIPAGPMLLACPCLGLLGAPLIASALGTTGGG